MKYTNRIETIINKLEDVKCDIEDDMSELEDKQSDIDSDSPRYDTLQDKIDDLQDELDYIKSALDELNNIMMTNKKLIVNKIIDLIYDNRPCAFHMEDPYATREKLSEYAYELLGLLGYKDKDKIKPEHIMIFRLTWLVGGDDEPFSDCGIDKSILLEELENIGE